MRIYGRPIWAVFLIVFGLAPSSAKAGAYSDAVLADGPVAYYRLGEMTGTVVTNSGTGAPALNGSSSTFANAQTAPATQPQRGQIGPRPGDVSGVYEIQGFETDNLGIRQTANVGAQVTVADNPLLDITGDTGGLTLEVWVNRISPQIIGGNTEGILAKFNGTGDQRSYALTYINSSSQIQFVLNPSGAAAANVAYTTGVDIPANEWVHLAAVWDPGVSMTVYMNGVAVGTPFAGAVPVSLFSGTAPLWIGRQFSTSNNVSFEGRIDEAAVYNKALSASQIAAHYAAAAGSVPTFYAWDQNSSGDWNVDTNWALDTIPNTNGQIAVFAGAITAPRVVYTNSALTVKGLRFDSSNQYAIAGTGTITLSAASGNSSVKVIQGAHEVQTAVTLGNNTDVNVTAGSVDFNNVLNVGTHTLHLQTGRTNINHSVVASGAGNIVNAATLGTAGATPFGGSLTSTGTLDIDLGGTGMHQYDAFNISGTATLSGLLDVELVNGFTLSGTESFTVLTAGTLVNNGITLAGSAADLFILSQVGNSLVLSTSVGVEGDYNGDGVVNAADYVLWRDTLGSTTNLAADGDGSGTVDTPDYGYWQARFGNTSGSGSGFVATVPEPSSLLLFAVAAFLGIGIRRLGKARQSVVALIGIVGALFTATVTQADYSQAVMDSNPVAYYRLGEADFSFIAANSGTGGFALDGFYNQFTEFTGPRSLAELGPRPGDIAGGYLIDGLEADNLAPHFGPAPADFTRVEVPDHPDLDITGALTLEAWVNRDVSTSTSNRGIVSKYASYTGFTNQRAYNLYYNPVAGHVGFVLSNDGANKPEFTVTTGARDLPVGEWTHVAATYNPATLEMFIYFNGQEVAAQVVDAQYSSIFDSAAPLWIGHQFSTTPTATFEGRIDEAAVYDRSLPASEILAHFEAATGAFVSDYAWNVDGSGSWSSLGNWNPGSAPNSNGVAVTFGNAITSPQTVFTESSVIAKSIMFNNASKYAVAGTGTIILDADTGNASISVSQGNHEFQAKVTLADDTTVNVASGSLSFNNVLNLDGHTLTIQSGTVHINHSIIPGGGGGGSLSNAGILGGAGAMAFGGDFANSGVLEFDLGGPGESDSFFVGGTAALGGSIAARFASGYQPSIGDAFTLFTAGNLVDNGIELTGPLANMMRMDFVGNSLVATVVAVPEPGSLALLTLSVVAMFGARRSRSWIRKNSACATR